MRKKTDQQKMYYLSGKLKRQLAQIAHYPLTIVEAPSGFGKTTAVKEYFKKSLPSDVHKDWYTCLGEPVSVAWKGICGLFSFVSGEIASRLIHLEKPTKDTLLYMASMLKDLQCETETYLVIDNYHLVDCDIPRELIRVFSAHGSANLHIILITQQLGPKEHFILHNADIHTVDPSAFFFDMKDIGSLFRMEGVCLSDDELKSVYASTEGWICAIRLQLMNYQETGSFEYTADIDRLVELAIWNGLSSEEKEFLLSVSVLDSFDARQAAIMMGKELLPGHIEDLLRSNDFIRYSPDNGVYTMHGILQGYLRNRFYHYQPEGFQKRILRLAGQACAAASQYCAAVRFFYEVRDFDAVFSLPFTHAYLDRQKESHQPEITARILDECPEEIKCKYPFALLLFGYRMLMDGQTEAYRELCRVLELVIQKRTDLSKEELREIEGEYLLLRSFDGYNDLGKMHEGQKKAWEVLGRPSKVHTKEFPFAFGSTSLLSMHWRETGGLEDTLRDMDEGFPYYLRLTRGHGAGADSVLRAEAMLMRGEDDEAEILCHKALYDARSHKQAGMCICAELVLARIAILRGDVKSYFNAANNIKAYAKEDSSRYILRMADACTSTLGLILDSEEGVSNWVGDMDYMMKTLYPPVIPLAQIYYARTLLMKKRYNELYGFSQSAIKAAENMNYMMPQVYHRIFLAAAKRLNGKHQEAGIYLKEALAMALPDQIYLPFAHCGIMEDFLSEVFRKPSDRDNAANVRIAKMQGDPAISLAGAAKGAPLAGSGIASLISFCKRHAKGVSAVKKALAKAKSPLTPREREILLLVKDRLSAQEIADRLYISKATVKTVIRNAYRKLDIHSRTELDSVEF